jgi:hypothetical protein
MTYLIQYGRCGFVGRFRSASALDRGARAVVRGPRGVEFGEVLVALDGPDADGEILRAATTGDETEAAARDARAQELLAAATAGADARGLPLSFADVEVTLDGTAILHALPWDACDATELLEALSARFGLAVRLLDLSRASVVPEPAEKGCGKPGCGSESGGCSTCGTGTGSGGGCSTGSCSRGSVKSADDLTAQFAELRRKMEAAGIARRPLN